MAIRIIIFLLINFGALALGGLFTGKGVPSDWYQELNKAPWTPPGWVFGAAWTLIMVCFSFYMAFLWKSVSGTKVLLWLFVVQFILNVIWNPVFFHFQLVWPGLIVISLLSLLIIYLFVHYYPQLSYKSFLILPYLIWLIIATSLNAYIVFNN
jgi:benzodiazapine receptor